MHYNALSKHILDSNFIPKSILIFKCNEASIVMFVHYAPCIAIESNAMYQLNFKIFPSKKCLAETMVAYEQKFVAWKTGIPITLHL